jgi:hypothetical protein
MAICQRRIERDKNEYGIYGFDRWLAESVLSNHSSAMINKRQANCRCWLLPALAVVLALPLVGEAQSIVHEQLPPSPSLGLVQDINGNWVDPFASYDAQGLRLWGTAENPASYSLILNGQVAFTFISQDSGFDLVPAGTNRVIGGYLDGAGAVGAAPLPSDTPIGPDAGAYTWFSRDQAVGGAIGLAAVRDSGIIGNPILWGGPFAGVASGYIGLEFYSGGQAYYGWIRIGAPASINGGWIYEYAYETIPNTSINTGAVPEPSTWAFLSFGSVILFIARRQFSSSSKFSQSKS